MDDVESSCLEADEIERFVGFANGALTRTQRAQIEAHIDRCAWCRRGVSEVVRSCGAEEDEIATSGSATRKWPWTTTP